MDVMQQLVCLATPSNLLRTDAPATARIYSIKQMRRSDSGEKGVVDHLLKITDQDTTSFSFP